MPDIHPPKASNTNGPFIFVSYSHVEEDRQRVYTHIEKLQRKGIAIWYDDALELGMNWLECVEKNVNKQNCIGVIFYISKNSICSTAVAQEMSLVMNSHLQQRFFFISLLHGTIKSALDNAKNNHIAMSNGNAFSLLEYGLYTHMLNGNDFHSDQSEVDKTYTCDSDDCLDRIVDHITNKC